MLSEISHSFLPTPMLHRANGTNGREAGRVRFLPVLILPLLLVLTGDVDGVSAQDVNSCPYTYRDAVYRDGRREPDPV
jgi:hypothetical protein